MQFSDLFPEHGQNFPALLGEPVTAALPARRILFAFRLQPAVLLHAAQQGMIVAIVKDRYYRNDRIVAFANLIRELDQARGSTCAADFRDRLNVGRKLAIQILEYFNRIGFTRRRGNDHVLRDAQLFP